MQQTHSLALEQPICQHPEVVEQQRNYGQLINDEALSEWGKSAGRLQVEELFVQTNSRVRVSKMEARDD
ncbi:MAG: hypothetical protein V4617_08045 [Gemmatimonadota bacterium]